VRQVELESSTKGKLVLCFKDYLQKLQNCQMELALNIYFLWIGGWTNENRIPSFSTSHIAS
jgi:hypothetical protein